MSQPVVTTTKQLQTLCDAMMTGDYVTVDTEFMREKTYWPKLCLVQIANDTTAGLIDPLAANIDLDPLFRVMAAPHITKVFHAARQDIEIFYHKSAQIPTPLFDTQIAAMVCGYGDQVGYENLVGRILQRPIDKSARFTNWSQRPLNPQQLAYALGDVTHLRLIYKALREKLDKSGRASWVNEEMAILADPKTYQNDPAQAWKKIKTRNFSPRFLTILRELAAWREETAQKRNMPRLHILRDDVLLHAAQKKPLDIQSLAKMRGVHQNFVQGKLAHGFIAAVKKGMALPEARLEEMPQKKDIPKEIDPIVDLLKVLLKFQCQAHDIIPRLVASSYDLEQIALGNFINIPALQGWRDDVFGKLARELIAGRLTLVVAGEKLKILPMDAQA